jgi:hypothetical protein
MTLRSAIQALWLGGLALQVLLAAVLLIKKSWRKFPIFTCYVIFNLMEGMLAYVLQLQHNRSAYLYTYIIGETISVALGLALVYEIFGHLFQPHPALRKLAVMVFRVAALLLVVLAGGVIYYSRSPFDARDIVSALSVIEEAARIMEVGLIMFLFLSASVFGLHWRQLVFGITLGLGISVAVKLAEVTLLRYAPSAGAALALPGMLSFAVSLFIWLVYAMAPERVASTVELPKTAQLERWNQAMMELIHQ